MLLELKGIHKHFGKVKANNGIDLIIKPGTIHGILGENGAGKSTLMKILSGYIQKTSGTMCIDGSPVDYHTPAQASQLGIGMLYQDPLDFPPLTVLENFLLGQNRGLLSKKTLFQKQFEILMQALNFELAPDTAVASLTIGERQQLEIVRLLNTGIEVLILDEPTTGISGLQRETLFGAIRKLAQEGKSIILVSHKLEEVLSLCDCVTVLRNGVVTGSMVQPYDSKALLTMMFGTPPAQPSKPAIKLGETIFSMEMVSGTSGRTGLSDCSISIRQGEVIGLAGLGGSGQEVFLRIASGLERPVSGRIFIRGKRMHGFDHHRFKKEGVTFLPASRLEEGLIAGMSIMEHFALQDSHGLLVRWNDACQKAEEGIGRFQVKGRPGTRVESLSGGNQQRLLLSFLPEHPVLLVLEHPTRGLDMESVRWVWEHLHNSCREKTSIFFSSAELDEIIMAADRVLVFFEGRVIKDVKTEETNSLELGMAMAGKV